MKQCPKCYRAYATDELKYCRHDGERLNPLPVEDETVALPTRETNLFFPKEGRKVEKLPPPAKPQGGLDEQSGEVAKVDEPVIAISINRQYLKSRGDADALFHATRSMWRVNIRRANQARYAFAVFKGVIKEVYEVERWIPATEATREYWRRREHLQGEDLQDTHDGRSEFVGKLAPQAVRQKYVGRRLPVRHSRNPIRYLNC